MERVFKFNSTGELVDCSNCFPITVNRWYSYQSCSLVDMLNYVLQVSPVKDERLITCLISTGDDLFIEFYYLGHRIRNSLNKSFIDNYEVDNKTMEYVTELIDKDRDEEFLNLITELFVNSVLL